MIWWILIGILGFILISFFVALNKDTEDLQEKTLDEKFNVIVHLLNEFAYNGNGKVNRFDKRQFNLYNPGSNQIIQFGYGTGSLTIVWKYKYLQKEIVHERTFDDVRNLSLLEQGEIANNLIGEMFIIIENHKSTVLGLLNEHNAPNLEFSLTKDRAEYLPKPRYELSDEHKIDLNKKINQTKEVFINVGESNMNEQTQLAETFQKMIDFADDLKESVNRKAGYTDESSSLIIDTALKLACIELNQKYEKRYGNSV